ncbi:MAG: helix-turn-helix transcriptional regulator [Syntrophomonas sp.]
MRDYLSINRVQLAYIIPASLYTLWQASVGWLNHYWTFIYLGREPAALLYIAFFLAHAAGIAAFAWWLDHSPAIKHIMKAVLVSSILTALFTAAMASGARSLLAPICLLSGLVSGLFMAYLSYFVFVEIPAHKRGITIGLGAALGVALHFVIFVLFFPQQDGSILYGKTFFSAFVILLLGISAVYLPACRNYLWPTPSANSTPILKPDFLKPGLVIPLLIILTGFFLSFGMQDYAASAFWMDGEEYLVYTRLFLIAGWIGGGVLCDKSRKHMMLNASFSLLAMGFISMAFQYKGAYSFIGFSCVQMAVAVFSVGTWLLFLDAAPFYRKPALICSLGVVFPLVLKQVGIISAEILYKTFGNMSIFIVSLLGILAVLPLVSILFEKFRDTVIANLRLNAPSLELSSSLDSSDKLLLFEDSQSLSETVPTLIENQPKEASPVSWAAMSQAFAEKYNFNPRETQVLELTLHGLSIAEMAQSLIIAEPTVKQYIRQMLRKTETKNRRELLSMLIKEQSANQ